MIIEIKIAIINDIVVPENRIANKFFFINVINLTRNELKYLSLSSPSEVIGFSPFNVYIASFALYNVSKLRNFLSSKYSNVSLNLSRPIIFKYVVKSRLQSLDEDMMVKIIFS